MNAGDDEDKRPQAGEGRRVSASTERRLTMIDNCLASQDLFVGTREIVIRHGADAYHLRLTAQNKLILTK